MDALSYVRCGAVAAAADGDSVSYMSSIASV
jgi:hypothetical protein